MERSVVIVIALITYAIGFALGYFTGFGSKARG